MLFKRLDPALEAARRLFVSDLDNELQFFQVAARKLRERNVSRSKKLNALTEEIISDWTLIRENLDDQTLQTLDERTQRELRCILEKSEYAISGVSVRQELRLKQLDNSERLRRVFYLRAHAIALRRFRPFAKILIGDRERSNVVQAIIKAPTLCEALGPSEMVSFERWTRGILDRIANEKIVDSEIASDEGSLVASSRTRTADEGAATRKQEQTGAPSAFPSPPDSGTPVAVDENSSLIELIRSSRTKPLTTLLGLVKSENPEIDETRALLEASDRRIADISSEAEQKRCYRKVHDSVPAGWKDGIGEQKSLVAYWDARDPKERGAIKSYVSRASSHLRQIVM